MSNLLFNYISDAMATTYWIALGILALFFLILRILMKHYISSIIMCFLFSIATIILSIFIYKVDDPMKLGPWIFYTTFSVFMFCLGPTYFEEGSYFEITIHTGIFRNSIEGNERSASYKFYYFFSRLALTFVAVNIVGFGGGTPFMLFVTPVICSIICLIRLIVYIRS